MSSISDDLQLSSDGVEDEKRELPKGVVEKFSDFVCSVCSLLIEADAPELHMLFHDKYSSEIKSFLTQAKLPILFVQKIQSPTPSIDEQYATSETVQDVNMPSYSVDLAMDFKEGAYGVVFAKRDPKLFFDKLDTSQSFSSLLQTVEISNNVNPFEFLRNFISTTFEPYFDSIEKKRFKEKNGISAVTESMESLKLALEQCQNKFKIPEINILGYVHPKVKDIIRDNSNLNDIEDLIKGESKILNEMGKSLQECALEINKLISPSETTFHSVVQEINYWESMEKALNNLDIHRQHTQILYTLKVLKEYNRKIPVNIWLSLPIEDALKNARNCYSLLKDIPINDLLTAKEIDKVVTAVEDTFKQLSKIKNNEVGNISNVGNSYPARGALLVEAISHHVQDKALDLLRPMQLMRMDFENFEKVIGQINELFTSLKHGVQNFEKICIVIAKKMNITLPSFTDKLEYVSLKRRLDEMRNTRAAHEQLRSVSSRAISSKDGTSSVDILNQVDKAFEDLRNLNNKVLDLGAEGAQLWRTSLKSYYEKIDSIESKIVHILKEKLSSAKSASEMFRVFSKFNPLFYMPKVRSAISQFQDRLVDKVREDITSLELKFKKHYTASEAERMSQLRDLPNVSGAIIWARQIEKQLDLYMGRIDSVFGNGWDRLRDMRQFNHFWLLNDKLSDFMGIPIFKLEHKMSLNSVLKSDVKPELKGTALALAFLELVYPDTESHWKIMYNESMDALQKEQRKLNINISLHSAALDMLREEQNLGLRHMEELKLRQKAEKLRSKLQFNINELLSKWNVDILNKIPKWKIFEMSKDEVSVRGFVFDVVKNKNDLWELRVNFHRDIGNLIKEVRTLTSLDMDRMIDVNIRGIILEACDIYPLAVSLIESVKTYNRVLASLDDFVQPLAAREIKTIQTKLSEGFNWPWKAANLESYCKELYEAVSKFQTIVSNLIMTNTKIQMYLDELKTCKTNRKALFQGIDNIQKLVDDIALEEAYSNSKYWVRDLNRYVESILLTRLQDILATWIAEYSNLSSESRDDGRSYLFTDIAASPFVVEIKVINRLMREIPAIQKARAFWISRLSICLSWIIDLPKIRGDNFENAFASMNRSNAFKELHTFRYLLTMISQDLLQKSFSVIESSIQEAQIYIQQWLQYQALWDIDMSMVVNQLGSDLAQWMRLLDEVSQAQSFMKTTDKHKDMGSIIVNFGEVYDQVSMKYGDTLKELLIKFRSELEASMKVMYSKISEKRNQIESMTLKDNDSIVRFLKASQEVKRNFKILEETVVIFKKGEQQLLRNSMKLPPGWKFAGNIESEWIALNEIVKRKDEAIKSSKEHIVRDILSKDAELDQRIAAYIEKHKKEKPLNGNLLPSDALRAVDALESRLKTLQIELNNICEAREALDLEPGDAQKLDIFADEINNLKSVWQSLHSVWDELQEVGETAFNSIMWRKVRRQLENMLDTIRKLSPWMLSYDAVDHLQSTIKLHIQELNIVKELREESMKDRHWQELRKVLNQKWILSELTLSHIWEAKVLNNEAAIREVLRKAQGEVSLENFIKRVKETWTIYQFELINYNNKCILIKGWDDLFKLLSDDLEGLSAMKSSQFFKTFEDETNSLDKKLNKIRITCDIWIDVQRVWIYLEGIFSGNADIRYQLPRETQKFQTINSDFKQLMRKVQANPIVFDVLTIPQVGDRLEKLNQSLIKVQKSLGEYLEKQRAAFPRFYFIGDEDLLEILGNSGDAIKVQKHLKKMFAGISSLQLENSNIVTGISSKEGEIIPFKNPVTICENQSVHEWLNNLEIELKGTLSHLTGQAIQELSVLYEKDIVSDEFTCWMAKYPAQVVVLSSQVVWTSNTEKTISKTTLPATVAKVKNILEILANHVLNIADGLSRKKYEHLITEYVYQRDVLIALQNENISSIKDFSWLYHMRYYWDETKPTMERLTVAIANALFVYGFEYQGVIEKLVQTPLTSRCYLALTQALNSRLGGSPFGPAGTGKTETVKALGVQLGRYVLVFNCDESFDYKAMERILVGLCQCGAWGCFDEFNRLEENILSAVSQHIQKIQIALRDRKPNIELLDRTLAVKEDTGIFITMNPGYAGRSNLPDNLKQLFRDIAMVKPDKELIAQVILYSQGFTQAQELAKKIVLFFGLCVDELSAQTHYDFGLRGLKSVLVNAGYLKRQLIESKVTKLEASIVIQSIEESMIPKLVGDDVSLLKDLIKDLFPGCDSSSPPLVELRSHIQDLCKENHFVYDAAWVEKMIQLYKIQNLQHGIMLVGPPACGKTSCFKILLQAMERLDQVKGSAYVIDPKALTKEELYGSLDPTTREWTDGVFTFVLRKIIDNLRGESSQRHWIVFDGDVDPEWVENLNSVLDDNKLFTLPNGERLALPPNVKIMFEVQNLKYATLATVSRCGMIWFSHDIVSLQMIVHNFVQRLKNISLEEDERSLKANTETPLLRLQRKVANIIEPYFEQQGFVLQCLGRAQMLPHIMTFSVVRALTTLFSLVNRTILRIHEYNLLNTDIPLEVSSVQNYASKRLIYSVIWGFGSSMNMVDRTSFAEFVCSVSPITLPEDEGNLLDYEVSIDDGRWVSWSDKVPEIAIETHRVVSADSMIPTMDTVRHEDLLGSWVSDCRSVILCGPPGSGKTMILTAVLRSLSSYDACFLNFSSATQPELVLKTFDQYCTVSNTPDGLILQPSQPDRWLVVFCDEINLPANDKYGTQRIITFMRQMIEQGGYWRASDLQWIKLRRIMFVGACNPPTDAGRVPMAERFLRHCPILFVDFPSPSSLRQIYGTFNKALLKLVPSLVSYTEATTRTMVDFFMASQQHFTPDNQPHYIYSPRELSRWIRAMYEAMHTLDLMDLDVFVRLLVHEGIRIFADRLVLTSEKKWTDDTIDQIVIRHFANIDLSCVSRPILFSNWMNKDYISVGAEELRGHLAERLRTFAEEELEVKLVLFDSVLEHILRIDRVLKQPLGHLLLVGVSGSGKKVLSRFAAWMNGYSVFQIKAHRKYTLKDFEDDLRKIMRRAGVKGEKLVFIFDESNVLTPSFLEYMNALLASGEVPGLFEGEEYMNLQNQCRDATNLLGLVGIDDDELYPWFIKQVQKNLHIVFTINPANTDFKNRSATSPALFNRCVIDWFGDWSQEALYQVGEAFTRDIHLGAQEMTENHQNFVNCIVRNHNIVVEASTKLEKATGRKNFITPRHYLDYIHQFRNLFFEKRQEVQDQQLHMNIGLKNLTETEQEVSRLQIELREKEVVLTEKKKQAKEKLDEMVENQKDAENTKKIAEVLSKQLDEETAVIEKKKQDSEAELSEVIPKLERAKSQIRDVPRNTWTTLRNYITPPKPVQKTLELVIFILFQKDCKDNWSEVKTYVSKSDFIQKILTFKPEDITSKMRTKLVQKLDELDPQTVNNASQVCFTMFEWMKAMIEFSHIQQAAEPLRIEVDSLRTRCDKMKQEHTDLMSKIDEMENKIKVYEEEYKALYQETNSIEIQILSVKSKVERSTSLIKSLSSETVRWKEQSGNFEQQIQTLVGDVLLSATSLTYSGYFDEYYRNYLRQQWISSLQSHDIPFKENLSEVEYLSIPDERLLWESNKLPNDNISVQNAIILNRFNRYPLVVDPTGQATEFILNQHARAKICKTSFSDASFLKVLESSIRFGTPILIQDAETFDPIVNPILNREIRKVGGRSLVTLGNQDIDLSPTFTMILVTRDPTHQFGPDVSSKVTFVNFTVTPSSLYSQCLNIILQSEKPDIDKQRSEQLKLQGEYKVTLRNLEQKLLDSLSEAKGNILENETLIKTLENLKNSSLEISEKVRESDIVMANMSTVSEQYNPLASFCSNIYFTMAQMSDLHFLYHFSLDLFFNILNYILKEARSEAETNSRVDVLIDNLFLVTYKWVSRSLMHEDNLPFALRLADIRHSTTQNSVTRTEKEFLFKKGHITLHHQNNEAKGIHLSETQEQLVQLLNLTETYKDVRNSLCTHEEEWKNYMLDEKNQTECPVFWTKTQNNAREVFRQLMMVKAFKPEYLLTEIPKFISAVLGDKFLKVPEHDLVDIVQEATLSTPLLLCSMPGYDASQLVEQAATTLRKQVASIAMGTNEAFDQANKAITNAIRKGTWVLLKNVHLSPSYLAQLEKRIYSIKSDKQANDSFRLFFTSEVHPSLPVNLLRRSIILMFESPSGVKAHLSQTFNSLSPMVTDRNPVERSRLYLLVAWFHSVVQARLCYKPIGWSKQYEFNQSDLKWSIDTIDKWVDIVSKDRSNIQPSQLPWKAIHVLLGQSIYGGKVDNEFDQIVLKSFLEELFTPAAYHPDFQFFSSKTTSLSQVEGMKYGHFMQWIDNLPENETPEWIGLSNNVSKLTKLNQANATFLKYLKISNSNEEDFESENTEIEEIVDDTPSWSKLLKPTIQAWLQELPLQLEESLSQITSNPLTRFFRRELDATSQLLSTIRYDLNELLKACDGSIRATNDHRLLIDQINRGTVPLSWKLFNCSKTLTVDMWITDFVKRIRNLFEIKEQIENNVDITKISVWMGGLLSPEAYLTATRQYISHKYQIPLEALVLEISLRYESGVTTPFIIRGLQLECSGLEDNRVVPSEELSMPLPDIYLSWVQGSDASQKLKLPLYLNSSRDNLLCAVSIDYKSSIEHSKYYCRGAAISAWY